MRSQTCCSIQSGEVHNWAPEWLMQAKLVRDHGWKCTAAVVLRNLLGLDPLQVAGRRRPKQSHALLGTPPLQTHVGLDRSRSTTPIARRWFKALHRLETMT